MNYRLKKKSTFFIILLTYILTLTVPLIVLFQFMFPKLEKELSSQLEESLQSEVAVNASHFNDIIVTLNNYALSLTENSTLSTNVLNNDTPLNRFIITEEFSKIINSRNELTFLFLYNKSFQRYYANNTSYPAEWMNSSSTSALYYPAFSSAELKEFCDNINAFTILEQKKVLFQGEYLNCLTIALPVQKTDFVLLALLPVDTIISTYTDNGTVLVINNEDQIIGGTLTLEKSSYDDICFFNFIRNNTVQQRSINGIRYLLHQADINLDGFRIISIYKYDSAMRPFHILYQQTALRCSAIFIIGFLLISGSLLFTYLPLKRIKKELLSSNTELQSLDSLNDWNIISMSIRHLNNRNFIMSEQLNQLQRMAQELFLCRYLYGDIRNEQSIIEMANIYTLFIHDYVTCIAFSSLSEQPFANKFITELKERFYRLTFHNAATATVSCYFVETLRSAEIILILFYDDPQELQPFLQIVNSLEDTIHAGIGSQEPLNNPSRSNALALAALENSKLENTRNVINYFDIPIADVKYLSKALEQISLYDSAITQKSASQAQTMFESVLKILFYSFRNNHVTQTLYMNLHNTIVRHLKQAGENFSPVYIPQDIPKDHTSMLTCLEQLHAKLLSELKQYPEPENDSATINQILQYIENNYHDVNISLLTISEKFGFSYSNFSHFFRKQTGSTFSNYLERLRIDKAKLLLRESDDVLNNIASQVGFNNIGTFTRAFKKRELIPPGTYRENFRKQQMHNQ